MCFLITFDLEHNVRDPFAGGAVSHGGVDEPVDEVLHCGILHRGVHGDINWGLGSHGWSCWYW